MSSSASVSSGVVSETTICSSSYGRRNKGKGKGKRSCMVQSYSRLNAQSALELPPPDEIMVQGPRFRPSSVICACCHEPGHNVNNCVRAIEERYAKSMTHCVYGYHKPYLHGVWRCTYCGTHLDDDKVFKQQEVFYRIEAAKQVDKVDKFGSPFTRWQ